LLAARRGALVLACLDAERLGEVMEDLRGLALGKQSAVEIDATLDYVIGGASKRLHDWPVSADICGRADFIPGAIDKRHVDVFKTLCRESASFNCRTRSAYRRPCHSRSLFSHHRQNVSVMTVTADCSLNHLRPKVQRAALFNESSVHVIMSPRNIAADMIEASCYVL
jgi:hypothetical protein